ncbi:sulfite exporter TauE/SafE family protein [Bacillus sp. RAR_GA_16]|uniref:sulfite exporter TauE/SafE family protein n=1 Tax=Bacillus sp. RAR_GA_16 TaxID=2876774 RepID=UPI001CCC3341|nr:sulfite exporter TauE/SafE family protein [Bacillus sp. RAR_GA_16]MCA0174555.1 sulfite exporter TauE/SafE family protein [Bacillus sp. RAR_GA_16]
MYLIMLAIGLFCGIITGLLSIGGGIILVFSLMLLLPLISGAQFPMQTIAGLSIMQSVFSTASGGYFYIRSKLVDRKIVMMIGVPAFFGGMIGVLIANSSSDTLLRIIFTCLAISAAVIMQVPYKSNENPKPFQFKLSSTTLTIIGSAGIGVLGGLVGVAAGFIFVPLMIFVYRLPIKQAIGSSLITCFLLAVGSFITKLSVETVPLGYGTMLIIGGILGAQIGGRITMSLQSITLKRIAAYSILIISIKLFYDLF